MKKKDPKVGTGKKPKGSGRRLYTDENPKDTVSVKFKTAADVRKTLSKKSFSPTLALGGMKLIGNDFMNTINNNGFGLSGIRLY